MGVLKNRLRRARAGGTGERVVTQRRASGRTHPTVRAAGVRAGVLALSCDREESAP